MAIQKLKDGYIFDYISGIQVPATPEEVNATQPFSKMLVEDYLYPQNMITTRPQHRVYTTPSDKKGYPIDIAVFEEIDGNKRLKMIVECKRSEVKLSDPKVIKQLTDYLTHSEAEIGVLYNGITSVYILKEKVGTLDTFREIPAIPKHLENVHQIGLYTKANLIKPHNLKKVFQDIRGWIAANGNIKRDPDIAAQIILLILCKLYDEKFTPLTSNVEFRATDSDSEQDIEARIKKLFKKTQAMYSDVLNTQDQIDFDGKTLRGIVSKLQRYCIIDADRDCVADAFEVFIGKAVKEDDGQFFTPKNIVKVIIEAVNITTKDKVIDSACGSGGFLVEVLKRAEALYKKDAIKCGWTDAAVSDLVKTYAIGNIKGIETDPFLTKLAKSYMAILGDGKGGIFREDSLENPRNWQPLTQASIMLNGFTALLANPPFGKNIKPEGEKLKQYNLAKKLSKNGVWEVQKTGNVSTLFLERNMQFVMDGGRVGIILPEPYFALPKYKNAIDFMFENNNIQWVIDLPHNTFRPHNNAKCCAIVIQKNRSQQEMINMAVIENCGHDHQGKPVYDSKGNIIDDTEQVIKEIAERNQNNGILKTKYSRPLTFSVPAKTVRTKSILVPRYYWQNKLISIQHQAAKEGIDLIPIKDLVDNGIIQVFDGHGSPSGDTKGIGDIPYIRVKDIVNWQTYIDVTSLIPRSEYLRIFTSKKALHPKDILYVSRGSYRIGSVAMISPYDKEMLLTREIKVIRMLEPDNNYDITPEYLMYAMSHKFVWEQSLTKIFYEPCLPNIADRWMDILIPKYKDPVKHNELKKFAEDIVKAQWDAQEKITNLRDNSNAFLI